MNVKPPAVPGDIYFIANGTGKLARAFICFQFVVGKAEIVIDELSHTADLAKAEDVRALICSGFYIIAVPAIWHL